MNGARAAVPADPRPAAPEAASRRRAEPVVLVPVSEAPAVAAATPAPMAATRDRLQAAIGATPALAAPAAEPAPVLTTRDRVANRAREAAAAPVVVPAVDVEARRRERTAAAPAAAPADGPPAVVIPLRRESPLPATSSPGTPARGPPATAPDSTTAPARAPPAPLSAPVVGVRPEPGAPAPVPPGPGAPAAAEAPAAPAPVPEAPAAAPVPAAAAPAAAPAAAAAPGAEAPAAAPPAAAAPAAAPEAAAPATPGAAAPAAAAPAAPVAAPAPEESRVDAFRARADAAAHGAKHHRPARKSADNAQAASEPNPVADVGRQAAEEQVNAMGDAQPGRFDAEAFKKDLQTAIAGMAPPATEEDAEDVEKSTDPGKARDTIHGKVTGGRDTAESAIKTTTEAKPNREDKKPKKPEDIVNDPSHPALPPVNAADAMPGEKPAEAADFSAATGEIDTKMQENGLTQDQLADSNEPTFTAVLDGRDAARAQAASAPMQYQAHEQVVLATARGEADAAAAPQVAGMSGRRAGVLATVLDVKHRTRDNDAKQRDDMNAAILDIHKQTRDDVHEMLTALDTKVEKLFTAYEESARADFEADVYMKMQNYKDDRYSGLSGLYHGARDYVKGLPKEVDKFYADGREKYFRAMERAIDKLANLIVTTLFMAHLRILWGRAQVKTYVEETLPASLRQLGRETANTLDHNFDTLESDIDAKRDELVQTIARKYVDAQTALDARIEELKQENRGLIDRVIDATIGVAKTIYELGKMLLRVLIKAASAIGDIVAHPIRFLENLIDAVGGGLNRFVDRIGEHLQEALLDLLFGEIGEAGITMPAALDFAGIVDLVLQVLGLTYGRIRERVVRRFGEPVVARLEQTVDIFLTLIKEGVAGLWAQIKEKLSDLEDLVIGKIKEYIVERVVMAGINYILALLTPVGAFIKACQTIYKIVMFIVEKAKQIADFVDSVLDSISAIAAGDVTSAVLKVEGALAGALKLAIRFLAELLNLGGLAAKVRSIIDLIRTPVTKIVDAIIFGAAELYRHTIAPLISAGVAKAKSGKDALRGKTKAEKHELASLDGDARASHAPPAAAAVPAVAAAPAAAVTEEPDEGPVHVYETFEVDGERHELYTAPDGELVVESRKRRVRDIADEKLQHLEDAVEGSRDELARVRRGVVKQRAKDPKARAAAGFTAARESFDNAIRVVVAYLRTDRALFDAPGKSAPGIGQIGRHGEQSTSIRDGPRVWYLESEHVIPFTIGQKLFLATGQLGPKRGSTFDEKQTTIMIYEGAARVKTSEHDGPTWRDFNASFEAKQRETTDPKKLRAFVVRKLGAVYDSAIAATVDAVEREHDTADRSGTTNGERRGEKRPIPTRTLITNAANQQYDDIFALVKG